MKKIMYSLCLISLFTLVGCNTYDRTSKAPEQNGTENSPTPEKDKETTSTEPVVEKPVDEPEVVTPEPVQPEPVKPEVVLPEPVKPEPVKPKPTKPEVVKPESVKPDAAKAIDLVQLDKLIDASFAKEASCGKVFTGNAGNYTTAKLTYARTFAYSMVQDLCLADKPGSIPDIFQQPSMNKKDALSLEQFNKGSSDKKSQKNLIATYALAYVLGQRESGGNFSEGRDLSASNSEATTEEAGLIQVSANSLNLKGTKLEAVYFLRSVFQKFVTTLSDMKQADKTKLCLSDKLTGDNESRYFDVTGKRLHELFESGDCNDLSETVRNLQFKITDTVAGCFRNLNKECPSFAIKYGAGVSRIRRDHNGPLILHEEFKKDIDPKYLKPYLVPSCHEVFQTVAKQDLTAICPKIINLK
jgi:hypothetical protein